MSSTVAATLTSALTIVETFTGGQVSTDNTITINGLNETLTLNATSTPPISKEANFTTTLSTGTATIDLTALPGLTADETVTFLNLKVAAVKFTNPSTNANNITVAKGGSSGYSFCGTTTFSIPIAPGQSVLIQCDGDAGTVGSGAKNIDLTGTGSQTLQSAWVAG